MRVFFISLRALAAPLGMRTLRRLLKQMLKLFHTLLAQPSVECHLPSRGIGAKQERDRYIRCSRSSCFSGQACFGVIGRAENVPQSQSRFGHGCSGDLSVGGRGGMEDARAASRWGSSLLEPVINRETYLSLSLSLPPSLFVPLSFLGEAIIHSNYAYRYASYTRIRAPFKARRETNARRRKKGRAQRMKPLLRQIKNRARGKDGREQ